jgi:hypothetical protein
MATWKKVVVSGSSAELAALKVDNLTSGSVVIGGGSTNNLGVRSINGNGAISATTEVTGVSMTGSFSGSFSGVIQGGTVIGSADTANTASKITITDTTTGTGPYYPVFVAGTAGAQFSLVDSATFTYNATTNTLTTTASFAISASTANSANSATSATNATSASLAATASRVANSLTLGGGFVSVVGTKVYDGSVATTIGLGQGTLISTSSTAINVNTASLVPNQIIKMGNNTLSGSNITDTGTQVQIVAGATSGLSVAAGGVNVTGNSIFNNNLTVSGDLAVNGTTTFINTTNLFVKDQFLAIASGSTSLVDAGIVAQYNSLGSGSALYLEAGTTGVYGRWAVAYDVTGVSTAVTADEYVVTAKINQASAPSMTSAPTWGSGSNGSGNLWVTNAGDIFIYA